MAAAVVPALAKAFALLATRLKTRHASPRTMLVAALTSLASGSIDDAAAITKLAFEMRFKEPEAKDPLAELSIHAFQLVEAMQATKDQPDVERFGALARRVDRMFESRGLNLSALVRGELQPAIDEAIGRARSAAP